MHAGNGGKGAGHMAYYDAFETFGDRIAAREDNGQTATYEDLARFCDRLGKTLPVRTLVFCFCENTIGSMFGYLAFLKNRVVPLLLDNHIHRDLAEQLTAAYRPAYVYAPLDRRKEFPGDSCIFEAYGYGLFRTGFPEDIPLYEDLALLLTTSGSTGSPKLVRQSYRNIQANAESIAEYLKLDETERPITTLRMNYTYGLSIINSHVLVGAQILLTNTTLWEKKFWEFFENARATSFGGVPYTYEMLKKLRFFRMKLPSLRTMTQAGGKLVPELHKEFAEYAQKEGKQFIVMYGQTEATARMGYLPAEKSLEKYGSMGIAIPGGHFTLIDVNGEPVTEPDVVGELVYEGPNVTLGYATAQEDLAKGDERNGRLVTGDMAKMDADGFYYIVGRKKRFLKIYGNRVNLDETERMVKRRFEELDCACSGVDDHMEVYITSPKEEDREAVEMFLREQTRLQGKAFTVYSIEKIPKNEAGKTLYKELKPNGRE